MATVKTAIVTGGSRGIGRGIALELAGAGWSVAVNYARNGAAADEVVAEIQKRGGMAAAIQANVAVAADRQRLVDGAVEKLGELGLLVNNAGISSPDRGKDLLDAGEAAFDAVMATNVKAAHFMSQLVARRMVAAGKRVAGEDNAKSTDSGSGFRAIINIGSVSAFAASVDRADYCISRAATTMVTQTWAVRLAGEGIGVYEVRPGIIRTDMTAGVTEKYDKLIAEGLLPIARWGEPGDVGRAVAMLASGVLGYSTGEVVHVDGGFHLRRL